MVQTWKAIAAGIAVLASTTWAQGPASLVVDRTPDFYQDCIDSICTFVSSDPQNLTVMGGIAYFSANDSFGNTELWRSDGTAAGTRKVVEINPRGGVLGEQNGSDPRDFYVFNNTLYFTAVTPEAGRELWKSDGTAVGTVMVRDFRSGPQSGFGLQRPDFTEYQGKLYFIADARPVAATGSDHGQICYVDGATGDTGTLGTGPNPQNPIFRNVHELEVSGGYLYFNPRGILEYRGLWRTDGTEGGFEKMGPEEINWDNLNSLTDVNGKLFFVRDLDRVLCRAGVTSATTEILRSDVKKVGGLTAFGNELIYSGESTAYGEEPWMSDGTVAGTRVLKDIFPGVDPLFGAQGSRPGGFKVIHGKVWFAASGPGADNTGRTLWITDGTAAGTQGLALEKQVDEGVLLVRPSSMLQYNETVYLTAFYVYKGDSYSWFGRSDGTQAGTTQLRDGLQPSATAGMVAVNNRILLSGSTGGFGLYNGELWASDGTNAGTNMLVEIANPPRPSVRTTDEIVAFNGKAYFSDWSVPFYHRARVSVSGGTAATTAYVDPERFHSVVGSVNGRLLLTDYQLLHTTNGTAADAIPIAGYGHDPAGNYIGQSFVRFGNRAIFAYGKVAVTDGTVAGTTTVLDMGGRYANHFTVADDSKVFIRPQEMSSASRPVPLLARELYVTDGTAANTRQILRMPTSRGHIDQVCMIGETAYFLGVEDGGYNAELPLVLWKSDGTEAGTAKVPGSMEFYSVKTLGTTGGALVFAAAQFFNGPSRLWAYDTSLSTFTLLANDLLYTGKSIRHNGLLFFTADDGVHGAELWRTDGTAAGTALTGDLNPGQASSTPGALASIGNLLLMSATRADVGEELFVLDRLDGAPWLGQDIRPGIGSSSPDKFRAVPELQSVFFFADNGVNGRDLWKVPVTGLEPVTAARDWAIYE